MCGIFSMWIIRGSAYQSTQFVATAEVTMTFLWHIKTRRTQLFDYDGKSRRRISNNAFKPSPPFFYQIFFFMWHKSLILSTRSKVWGEAFPPPKKRKTSRRREREHVQSTTLCVELHSSHVSYQGYPCTAAAPSVTMETAPITFTRKHSDTRKGLH